ncbi:hypothetical protein BamMC406_6695 (plasmid) [Burkholderia ambifaria MC40-6]|uniref:Uncharacterized protein n=1 Tax=Burkholderia ambifaria (strain MC40-6) TaxID=398577 RepID=B1Z6M1_BURA4|nr:hypothetical protein [Burkholderia ambifaria]ACB69098.1 hypothetical protein BamMC406_6695 [Burkholderia ambifaria MC40-6]
MSQLVKIAPGVVFSSDVLGAEWARKYRPDDAGDVLSGNTRSTDRPASLAKKSDHAIHESISSQMSLL